MVAEPVPSAVEIWACEIWGRSGVLLLIARLSSIDERLLDPQLLSVRLLVDEALPEVYEEKEQWNSDDRNDRRNSGSLKS